MTAAAFFAVIIAELSAVVGQLLFKLSMNESEESRRRRAGFFPIFAAGVLAMAINFLAWIALLARYELSFVYPFEALSRLMLLAGAVVFLKEKITPRIAIGALLITAGIVLVSFTD